MQVLGPHSPSGGSIQPVPSAAVSTRNLHSLCVYTHTFTHGGGEKTEGEERERGRRERERKGERESLLEVVFPGRKDQLSGTYNPENRAHPFKGFT